MIAIASTDQQKKVVLNFESLIPNSISCHYYVTMRIFDLPLCLIVE